MKSETVLMVALLLAGGFAAYQVWTRSQATQQPAAGRRRFDLALGFTR